MLSAHILIPTAHILIPAHPQKCTPPKKKIGESSWCGSQGYYSKSSSRMHKDRLRSGRVTSQDVCAEHLELRKGQWDIHLQIKA